jgi:hypothetical protein
MSKTNLKTRSGNRTIILMDGKEVGLIQSVRMSDDYSPEPASGIGDIHAVEYVPSMARHNITVQQMCLNTNTMRSLGVSAANGDDMLRGQVFDFLVVSKDDGQILRKYEGCSYASGEAEVQKHAIVMATGQFNALNVSFDGI